MNPAAAEPLIRLSGITKTYGQGDVAYQALRGIDLDVDAGDFIAIMGPSGSGKSTAMNIVGCLDTPSSGEIPLSRNPRRAAGSESTSVAKTAQPGVCLSGLQPAGPNIRPGKRGAAPALSR